MDINEFKVQKCLQCDALTDPNDSDEWFCSKCGAPVVNRCSDYNCARLLKEDALFCKFCGSKSTFNNYGLLSNTAPKFSDNTNDLPF